MLALALTSILAWGPIKCEVAFDDKLYATAVSDNDFVRRVAYGKRTWWLPDDTVCWITDEDGGPILNAVFMEYGEPSLIVLLPHANQAARWSSASAADRASNGMWVSHDSTCAWFHDALKCSNAHYSNFPVAQAPPAYANETAQA